MAYKSYITCQWIYKCEPEELFIKSSNKDWLVVNERTLHAQKVGMSDVCSQFHVSVVANAPTNDIPNPYMFWVSTISKIS